MLFDALKAQPADTILQLIGQFRADPRHDKIDLGVGVYKDPSGLTPVMRAVKAAEARLWREETTKTYTALAGDPAFHAAMAGMVFAGALPEDRLAAAATPGGTGAIRQALELVRYANPAATIWVPDPTWPNHLSILTYLGMPWRSYRYYDSVTGTVDFAGLAEDLRDGLRAGDVVLLHGCCHNPTGANPTLPEWQAIAQLLEERDAVPLIDLAYQGFGDGLDADAAGTRLLVAHLPEALVAASCSKNFGIYRERTGMLFGVTGAGDREGMQATLAYLNRQNYSFPPDHGARLVTMVLTDPELRRDWQSELEDVRLGMLHLRRDLAEELRRLTGSDRFGFLTQHRGMFSRLGASPAEVERLRKDHGIYMVGDGRMNIAGLNAATVPVLARAIATVMRG